MKQQKKQSQGQEVWKRLKRNRSAMLGLFILAVLTFSSMFANMIAPYSYDQQNLSNLLQEPSLQHWFWTDNFGRDIFSRVLYGGRISLIVGLISVGIGCSVGGTLGAMAAYYGGRLETIIMRIMDVMLTICSLNLLGDGLRDALDPRLKR